MALALPSLRCLSRTCHAASANDDAPKIDGWEVAGSSHQRDAQHGSTQLKKPLRRKRAIVWRTRGLGCSN